MARDLSIRSLLRMQQRAVDAGEGAPLVGRAKELRVLPAGEHLAEGVVHPAPADDRYLAARGHGEVLPPEVGDRLTGVLLDGLPVGRLDLALLLVRETHQHVVVDELVIAERLAGRIEALEDLLRVRPRAERDGHVLELLQAPPDPRRLVETDLTAEEGVVVVEPGVALRAGRKRQIEHDTFEDGRPCLMRTQLRPRGILRVHEDALQFVGHRGVVVADGVAQGGGEEHERRRALLAVDEHELGVGGVTARGGEDGADEVHVPIVQVGHRTDVGEKLLARADVPPVLPLIHRDDDRPLCG
jgi:hypothetical protein